MVVEMEDGQVQDPGQGTPQMALLSAAAGDWWGMPSPETLEAVEGYPLLRTDRNGWIHISTAGKPVQVMEKRGCDRAYRSTGRLQSRLRF